MESQAQATLFFRAKFTDKEISDEQQNIRTSMQGLIEQFDSIRGKSQLEGFNFPFWNMVVISAADDVQRIAFETQIEYKLEAKELPLDVPFIVISDPEGPKIGNGGSTFHVLEQLHLKLGAKILKQRTLLIHAGGYSQRLPTASVLGKLFTALPIGEPMYQMLELKLAMYLPFVAKMDPGLFVVCSDDIETYYLGDSVDSKSSWSFKKTGCTALAHKGDVEIGENHGVYVLPEVDKGANTITTFGPCLEVLQKPTKLIMKERGAIYEGFGVCTDSSFFFSSDVLVKLIAFYRSNKPILCEVDSYRDFLQALGSRATTSYIKSAKTTSEESVYQMQMQEKIFKLMQSTPLHVLLLHWSRFYHLGTFTEYIENLTGLKDGLFKELGFSKWISSKLTHMGMGEKELQTPVCFQRQNPFITVLHSIIPSLLRADGPAVIEYCNISCPAELGKNCVLSNCSIKSSKLLRIPSNSCFHTIPIQVNKKSGYVTVAFGTDDDLKKVLPFEELTYFGRTLIDAVAMLTGTIDETIIFDGLTNPYNLWNAKLFPIAATMTDSFKETLNTVLAIASDSAQTKQFCWQLPRMSMADILKSKDTINMINYRKELSHLLYK